MIAAPFSHLFSKIDDRRKTRHKVCVMTPVGDNTLIESFISMLKKQTLKDFDLLFIYPHGAEFYYDEDLSMIHIEEKLPLGTSGCFFAGQAYLYSQGYEIIIVADIDAIPSSEKMLEVLVNEAKKCKCVCLPFSTPETSAKAEQMFNVNQYGTYHRSVFEIVGFATPFFWRGGEDWDIMKRLKDKGLLKVVKDFSIRHPTSGYTIYHKLVNKKKFYPYVSSIMKAFLFRAEFAKSSLLRYIKWYLFYRFFSIVFDDLDLKKALDSSVKFRIVDYYDKETVLRIEKTKDKSDFRRDLFSRLLTNGRILIELIIKAKSDVYTDTIYLQNISRWRLLINTILATLFMPFALLEGLFLLLQWLSERKKVIYPVFPGDIAKAVTIYAKYIEDRNL